MVGQEPRFPLSGGNLSRLRRFVSEPASSRETHHAPVNLDLRL